jgi:hypothetical protein
LDAIASSSELESARTIAVHFVIASRRSLATERRPDRAVDSWLREVENR